MKPRKMKTWRGWCVVRPNGITDIMGVFRGKGEAIDCCLSSERVAIVEVREVPPKRRRGSR